MCTTYFGIVEDYSKIWLHLCDWFFNFSQENGCLAYESGVIATSQNLLAHGALIKMSCAPLQVVIFGPKNVYTSMISFVHSVRPDFFLS